MHQPHARVTQPVTDISPYPAHCRFCRKVAAFAIDTSAGRPAAAAVAIQCRACGKKWEIGKVVQARVA